MSNNTEEMSNSVEQRQESIKQDRIEVLELILQSSRQSLDTYAQRSGARLISSSGQFIGSDHS